MSLRKFVTLGSVLLSGALATAGAQAGQNLHWQVSVETPVIRLPGHVVLPLPPILVPRVVTSAPRHDPRVRPAPRRGDADGDGIPNRHDRVYNPRWDRDGDGVPNRYDAYPNDARNGHGWRSHDGRRDERTDHRHDSRDDNRDDARNDSRYDNRYDSRSHGPRR